MNIVLAQKFGYDVTAAVCVCVCVLTKEEGNTMQIADGELQHEFAPIDSEKRASHSTIFAPYKCDVVCM